MNAVHIFSSFSFLFSGSVYSPVLFLLSSDFRQFVEGANEELRD
ncbi:hypothetical protein BSM4216_0185 [Bacillus smithii]|nr:hypothetical protein BSM4216_0185 [Bacillus smithii]